MKNDDSNKTGVIIRFAKHDFIEQSKGSINNMKGLDIFL